MQLAKWLILFGFVSLGSFCFSLPTFKILVVLELSAVATHSSSNDIIDDIVPTVGGSTPWGRVGG